MTHFGPFELEIDSEGVGIATFNRPPVNAVSLDVYEALARLGDAVEASHDVRVLVLSSPGNARAWCGGADLHDFVDMDRSRRSERYEFINASLPRIAALSRPVIAAINAPAVGMGVILAGICDLRVAADSATFACPEIDFGLVAGGGGLFAHLKMPEGFLRELLYTGRRFSADEMHSAGFLNYVVPRSDVLPKALEIAHLISRKSLPALQARKRVLLETEGLTWLEGYLVAQRASGELVENRDSSEGVTAFLEGRDSRLSDT